MNPIPCPAVPIPVLYRSGAWRAVTADVLPALLLLGGALAVLALSGLAP